MIRLWPVASWVAIITGMVFAVTAPNGFPGTTLVLIGIFSLGAYLEREET